jgi:hypothetical protein
VSGFKTEDGVSLPNPHAEAAVDAVDERFAKAVKHEVERVAGLADFLGDLGDRPLVAISFHQQLAGRAVDFR